VYNVCETNNESNIMGYRYRLGKISKDEKVKYAVKQVMK
jgi:hypothetical protein